MYITLYIFGLVKPVLVGSDCVKGLHTNIAEKGFSTGCGTAIED